MPTFYLNGNLVHFAAAKQHLGFYPTPSAIQRFSKELRPFKTSKGAIQFPYTQELPLSLIQEIVKFRVQENKERGTKITLNFCPTLKTINGGNRSNSFGNKPKLLRITKNVVIR